MRIIILTESRGESFSLRPMVVLGGLLFCFIAGGWLFNTAAPVGTNAQQGDIVGYSLASERAALTKLEQDVSYHLDTLSSRLGELQGHMLRLDALGSRLVQMAGLKDIVFDNSQPLGIGGVANEELESIDISQFVDIFATLDRKIVDRGEKLTAIETMLMNNTLQKEMSPAGWPTTGGWISSGYGQRTDPVSGKLEHHLGIDFAGKQGSPVVAVASGIVTFSARNNGYGDMIEISHSNGYVTRYAHNEKNLVQVGDKVNKGQIIARVGSSGRSTGPHVHFEVIKNGRTINPKKFIALQ